MHPTRILRLPTGMTMTLGCGRPTPPHAPASPHPAIPHSATREPSRADAAEAAFEAPHAPANKA